MRQLLLSPHIIITAECIDHFTFQRCHCVACWIPDWLISNKLPFAASPADSMWTLSVRTHFLLAILQSFNPYINPLWFHSPESYCITSCLLVWFPCVVIVHSVCVPPVISVKQQRVLLCQLMDDFPPPCWFTKSAYSLLTLVFSWSSLEYIFLHNFSHFWVSFGAYYQITYVSTNHVNSFCLLSTVIGRII